MTLTIFFPREARLVLPQNSKFGTQKSKLKFLLLESPFVSLCTEGKYPFISETEGKRLEC